MSVGLLPQILRQQIRRALLWRAGTHDAAHRTLHTARHQFTQAERRLLALSREAERLRADLSLQDGPFSADMTIDQAWRRHPGAGAVFALHHLPACPSCAVRFDETLEEAADAYGLPLPALLAQLNALL